jgi:hypothetical protein
MFYESKGFMFVPPAELEAAKAEDRELQAKAASEYVPPKTRRPRG